MLLREETEQREFTFLSSFATKSAKSLGRLQYAKPCDIRTEFQRDRDKITHSKAFRRLMHKTQVFISPEGDHYRTRLTHTLEVAQIARTIARALRLNEDLTEAIALGHDLGHTPFGHTGEDALNKLLAEGFRHNEQSVRVVTKLERSGEGLNLTAEVIDGILCHRSSCKPSTLEGVVVQLSDKIGYINHDIDDAIRANILRPEDLPKESISILGNTSRQRIHFLICNVVENSMNKQFVSLSDEAKKALGQLRGHMFSTVYQSQLQQKERDKIQYMLSKLFYYYESNMSRLPEDFRKMVENGEEKERVICDYIAGMTDRFALKLFANIVMPNGWI